MSEAFYSKEHQWVRIDGNKARVGITDFAQASLGDVVFVEMPALGTSVAKGEQAAVVESVKAASEVYSPVGGVVISVNEALGPKPELVNSDPEGEGWFFTLEVGSKPDYAGLMTAEAYADYVKTLE
jgi:glycine cleavage system H protein